MIRFWRYLSPKCYIDFAYAAYPILLRRVAYDFDIDEEQTLTHYQAWHHFEETAKWPRAWMNFLQHCWLFSRVQRAWVNIAAISSIFYDAGATINLSISNFSISAISFLATSIMMRIFMRARDTGRALHARQTGYFGLSLLFSDYWLIHITSCAD